MKRVLHLNINGFCRLNNEMAGNEEENGRYSLYMVLELFLFNHKLA